MTTTRHRAQLSRRYAPLVVLVVPIILLAVAFPNALRLPQTNPAQTLEYAPVPPTDKNQPPPSGNVSALALGTSSSGIDASAGGNGPAGGPPPPKVTGIGSIP